MSTIRNRARLGLDDLRPGAHPVTAGTATALGVAPATRFGAQSR